MAEANINDRASFERVYDRHSFEQDAAMNARSDTTVVHGVTILSAPDAEGFVELSRTSQHVGEGNPEGDPVFIAAFRLDDTAAENADTYAGSVEPAAAARRDAADDYRAFIDQLLDTASTAQFKSDIGRGEERLKGFHGG
ncbi:hypothetical protein SAMN02982917_2434 [Azospirillum oryzae]|uniref:Uncharacterized protein n=1 Tax=Azospirillum oryzae TaxID=286727 RepID=A0A1X7FAE6_9PROT|nr:hypothetical protein [Azospirillum oryzae]SMF49168.1 hypothetical protein SAMN02982917_2434 [Azospirillum oryzae]